MTRIQWLFVVALVVTFSYGLLPAEPVVQSGRFTAAQQAFAVGLTPTAASTSAPTPTALTPRPTFTPMPMATASPTIEEKLAATPPEATPEGAATPSPAATPEDDPAAPPDESPTAAITSEQAAEAAPAAEVAPVPITTPGEPNTHPEEPRSLYVDQFTQRLYVYEYGVLLREIPCSTGLPESDKYTPAATGRVGSYWPTFTSFGVQADDGWFLFKSSGNILIHGLPYTVDEQGNKVYQDREALGVRPASHGCVRISPEDAQWLTAWNPQGALFEVTEPFLDKWLATSP